MSSLYDDALAEIAECERQLEVVRKIPMEMPELRAQVIAALERRQRLAEEVRRGNDPTPIDEAWLKEQGVPFNTRSINGGPSVPMNIAALGMKGT